MFRSIILYICLIYITCSFAQEVNFSECTDSDPKGWCKINKVEIIPCKEAGTNKPCSLKKGKNNSIKMYFNALQPIDTMTALPYWAAATGDLPFIGMEDNACEFTQCPIAQNANQVYDFTLKLAKSLPRGQFDVKYKFWANNVTSNGCCARFYLKLT